MTEGRKLHTYSLVYTWLWKQLSRFQRQRLAYYPRLFLLTSRSLVTIITAGSVWWLSGWRALALGWEMTTILRDMPLTKHIWTNKAVIKTMMTGDAGAWKTLILTALMNGMKTMVPLRAHEHILVRMRCCLGSDLQDGPRFAFQFPFDSENTQANYFAEERCVREKLYMNKGMGKRQRQDRRVDRVSRNRWNQPEFL